MVVYLHRHTFERTSRIRAWPLPTGVIGPEAEVKEEEEAEETWQASLASLTNRRFGQVAPWLASGSGWAIIHR